MCTKLPTHIHPCTRDAGLKQVSITVGISLVSITFRLHSVRFNHCVRKMLVEAPFASYVLPCAAVFVLCWLLLVRKRASALPDLPWINYREDEYFGRLRAKIRTTFNYKSSIQQCYQQVSVSNSIDFEPDDSFSA